MIRFVLRLPLGEVTVSLPVDDAADVADLGYEGGADDVEEARHWLGLRWGRTGHRIADRASGFDLAWALTSAGAEVFRPRLVEGARLLDAPPAAPPPPGRVT